MEMQYIEKSHTSYPQLLKEISDPPKGLFWRGAKIGEAEMNGVLLSVVGARKVTAYGLAAVDKIIGELAGSGVIIVSGLAFGVDAAAHRAALKYGLKTIAVLPGGVDDPQPRSHRNLASQILAAGGALVSEYPAGTVAQKWHFPVRNRIVAGMSRATLVVEAGEKSGSLITARLAMEENREVLAVPGSIFSAVSAGTNRFISEGARLVTCGEDILAELGIDASLNQLSKNWEERIAKLEESEAKVFTKIALQGSSLDNLIETLEIPSHKITSIITSLELQGFIVKIGNEYTTSK